MSSFDAIYGKYHTPDNKVAQLADAAGKLVIASLASSTARVAVVDADVTTAEADNAAVLAVNVTQQGEIDGLSSSSLTTEYWSGWMRSRDDSAWNDGTVIPLREIINIGGFFFQDSGSNQRVEVPTDGIYSVSLGSYQSGAWTGNPFIEINTVPADSLKTGGGFNYINSVEWAGHLLAGDSIRVSTTGTSAAEQGASIDTTEIMTNRLTIAKLSDVP
jgi:hypothetical protein